MRFSFLSVFLLFTAMSFGQKLTINDSLGTSMPNAEARRFLMVHDSANRILMTEGMQKRWGKTVGTIYYRDGLAYIAIADSLVLFQVMIQGTGNVVDYGTGSVKAQCKRRGFHWHNWSKRKTRETVERKKGREEVAYTIYSDDSSGLTYRVFFREGKVYDIMLYLP